MRHEPYQSYEGEIFTMSRKGIYRLYQNRNKRIVTLTEQTFNSQEDARKWVEPQAEKLKVPGQRLFVAYDNDD